MWAGLGNEPADVLEHPNRPRGGDAQSERERKQPQRDKMKLSSLVTRDGVCTNRAHSPFLSALQKEFLVGGDELELGGFLSDPLQPLPH